MKSSDGMITRIACVGWPNKCESKRESSNSLTTETRSSPHSILTVHRDLSVQPPILRRTFPPPVGGPGPKHSPTQCPRANSPSTHGSGLRRIPGRSLSAVKIPRCVGSCGRSTNSQWQRLSAGKCLASLSPLRVPTDTIWPSPASMTRSCSRIP